MAAMAALVLLVAGAATAIPVQQAHLGEKVAGPGPGLYGISANNLAAMDSMRGIYYFVGFNLTTQVNALLGLNLDTGAIDVRVELPFSTFGFIGVGETVDVDPFSGDVFVSGLDSNQKHNLYRVNSQTHELKKLASVGDLSVLGGCHAYDAKNEIVWIQYAVNNSGDVTTQLFGFDAHDGTIRHQIKPEGSLLVSTLSYDVRMGIMYGLGFDTAADARTIVSLDGATGEVLARLGSRARTPWHLQHQNYLIENGGIATIDSRTGILYSQLEAGNGTSTAPFHLVGYDIYNKKVRTQPSGKSQSPCLLSHPDKSCPHVVLARATDRLPPRAGQRSRQLALVT
ncbi:uncharacterized protein MONBRDRAFT_11902 [Monosiga brevicollis MX1]|uniref:Uncharacterized protein n=1 Tax=Monosiga brevicollis TaxID=81824 RepID=A9VAM2_MONBE|nr:uncharacterized protein MONBRDRAFT_11902 [Monosiga brevicollis MX1]EDQ85347.1 predicted protein [Monosiga brevicollis MX1]|eukprot:XP_001749758.1 hypothetical protein [Monosiga brevicollis MX1]